MKLKDKDRKKVVERIRKGLKNVLRSYDIRQIENDRIVIDASRRIKIPKEYEDEVLFDYFNDISGRVFKKFAITEGLYKIDLSDVDLSYICLDLDKSEKLNLSYSNLNIDFRKTYQFINDMNEVEVKNIDFSHTDLSNCDFQNHININFESCDLSYTNLHLKNGDYDRVCFYYCDLIGNDLSNLHFGFDGVCFGTTPNYNTLMRECDLSGTGVNIKISKKLNNKVKNHLKVMLKNGYLDGCYINGNRVRSKEECKKAKVQAAANYLDFVNAEVERVLEDIQAQINSSKKKAEPKSGDFVLDDDDDEDEKLGISSSYGYDQDKIEKACEAAGKIKSNEQYAKKKSNSLILTPEQDHDLQNFYGAL